MATLSTNYNKTKLLYGDFGKTKLGVDGACCVVECMNGRDIEIVMAGISNGNCSNCTNYNGTYIRTLSTIITRNCCVSLLEGTSACASLSGTPSGIGLIYLGKSPGGVWRVFYRLRVGGSGGTNVCIDWRETGSAALDILHQLCAGEQAEVPYFGTFDDAGESTTCTGAIRTLAEYDVYGTSACNSDGTPVKLQLQ